MLYANTGHAPRSRFASPTGPNEIGEAAWYDLIDPTEAERAEVAHITGLRVPTRAETAEIETSSRLATEAGVLYLSTPMTYPAGDSGMAIAPLGFVLAPGCLITIRYAEIPVFDDVAERFAGRERPSGASAFLLLFEAIVDRLADVLERVGLDLQAISQTIFRTDADPERNSNRIDARLRGTLRAVGRLGEKLADLRDSLIGVQRIAVYVTERGGGWIEKDLLHRCSTTQKDIASLMDYDVQLGNKVQFLLDATLGFINIEQNNGIKVLTVVSVVGVPPTLIASIYGMNFKWIPELQWEYGYFYGLAVIVLSAFVPLLWFRRRGWI